MFQSNYLDEEIERLSLHSKNHFSATLNPNSLQNSSSSNGNLGTGGGGSLSTNSTLSSHRSSSGSNLLNSSHNTHSNSNSGTQLNQQQQPSQIQQQQPGSPQSFIASLSNQQTNLEHSPSSSNSSSGFQSPFSKICALLAISFKSSVRLWLVSDEVASHLIGNFSLNAPIDHLFFIGSQLVTLGSIGKIGVWNSLSQMWQAQDITPISSFDTAGSFLLLGGQNGVLYYIDMQKFPLRMKDNDLLVTELYKDPLGESITALSVYLTPKTSNTGNWIEIAYGTNNGTVRVIVQHPETVGHGPQLFQSFSVHRGLVQKVKLVFFLNCKCSFFSIRYTHFII